MLSALAPTHHPHPPLHFFSRMRPFHAPLAALFLATCPALLAQEPGTVRLPETTVLGLGGFLSEEAKVGVTQRPEWTGARRFTGTRVYLQQDPWEVGIESWWRFKNHRDNSFSHRLLEEVE